MFAIPWYTVILESIPQMFLIIKIGFELFNIKIDLGKTIAISTLIAFCTYFIRQAPLFGLHTLVLVLLLALFATFFYKINWWYSLVSSLTGTMIMGLIEKVWLDVIFEITSTSVDDLSAYTWFNMIIFALILIMASLLYVIIKRFHFTIYDLNNNERDASLTVIVIILSSCFLLLSFSHSIVTNPENIAFKTFYC
ncbi:Uncharacterized [Syntrophomonas zehnderi OL-4]|uniref:Uncharacterized n=1 Tax=Syntrophomonas zehnderi OL-4 TaxID=690567 RepID=A0A0E3W3X3_9FIRM|nr:hypothetical protein [Syntrophomonas zehnderi]CFY10894.1 Uncharacterized [Syntrophomonas zehnderi OL-4]